MATRTQRKKRLKTIREAEKVRKVTPPEERAPKPTPKKQKRRLSKLGVAVTLLSLLAAASLILGFHVIKIKGLHSSWCFIATGFLLFLSVLLNYVRIEKKRYAEYRAMRKAYGKRK